MIHLLYAVQGNRTCRGSVSSLLIHTRYQVTIKYRVMRRSVVLHVSGVITRIWRFALDDWCVFAFPATSRAFVTQRTACLSPLFSARGRCDVKKSRDSGYRSYNIQEPAEYRRPRMRASVDNAHNIPYCVYARCGNKYRAFHVLGRGEKPSKRARRAATSNLTSK